MKSSLYACLFASALVMAPHFAHADESNPRRTEVRLGGEALTATNGQTGGQGAFDLEIKSNANERYVGMHDENRLRFNLSGGATTDGNTTRPLVNLGIEVSEEGPTKRKISGLVGDPHLFQVSHDHDENNYFIPNIYGAGAGTMLPNGIQLSPDQKMTIGMIPILGTFHDYSSHMTSTGAQTGVRSWVRFQATEKLRLEAELKAAMTFGGSDHEADAHQAGVGFNLIEKAGVQYRLGEHLVAQGGVSVYDNLSGNIRKKDGSLESRDTVNLTLDAGVAGRF
jgi:hypothetical protein